MGLLTDLLGDGNATSGLEVIAESVLAADAASINFASIPSTYRHLMIDVQMRGTTAGSSTFLLARFNGDTAANYMWQRLYGNDATAGANASASDTAIQAGVMTAAAAPAGVPGHYQIIVANYASTTFFKTLTAAGGYRTGNTTPGFITESRTGWWNSTAAINQLTLLPAADSLLAGSVATLYGLKGA